MFLTNCKIHGIKSKWEEELKMNDDCWIDAEAEMKRYNCLYNTIYYETIIILEISKITFLFQFGLNDVRFVLSLEKLNSD